MPRTNTPEPPSAAPDGAEFVLHLYVAGNTVHSVRAIVNVRRFCETHLQGRYLLEVFDVSLHPHLAAAEQLVALPTLLKKRPDPPQRLIGDLSDHAPLHMRLDL